MKPFRLIVTAAALITPLAMIGCKSSDSSNSTQTAATTEPAEKTYSPAPAGTPFAKIKVGMDQKEVTDILGAPTDVTAYVTGKAFVPFNFGGGDTHRTQYHYKDQGRIIFSNDSRYTSGQSVVEIEYDTTETGYPQH
jgi:hypothetical protein